MNGRSDRRPVAGRALAAALGCAALLGGAAGCHHYRDVVDPCYPERYNYMAARSVTLGMAPQVNNGHVLDQTVWNYHFEPGTDVLNGAGLEKLGQIARRRPGADTNVFVQTAPRDAQALPYDPANPDKFVTARSELDAKRVNAVQKYLAAYTGGRDGAFHVTLHDPTDPGISAVGPSRSVLQMYGRFEGGLQGGGGTTTIGGGGSSGGGSGGGGTRR